jgi:hypothetical protein
MDVAERIGADHNDVTTRLRLGNLAGINDAELGQLAGYGLFAENANLKGSIFATGRVPQPVMMRVGLVLNLLSVALIAALAWLFVR